MARTKHHHAYGAHWRDPAGYRRAHSRLNRARCNHLVRIERYDLLPPLRAKKGWYW
jgi:hypothetical protein